MHGEDGHEPGPYDGLSLDDLDGFDDLQGLDSLDGLGGSQTLLDEGMRTIAAMPGPAQLVPVPLFGKQFEPPFLKTDRQGRPRLHVYRVVPKVDRAGRRNYGLQFVGLFGARTDESDLAEHLPPALYRVKLLGSTGTVMGSTDVNLGGVGQFIDDDGPILARTGVGETTPAPRPEPAPPDTGVIVEMQRAHIEALAALRAEHRAELQGVEARAREASERAIADYRARLDAAEQRTRDAEQRAADAERRAVESRVNASVLEARLAVMANQPPPPAPSPDSLETTLAQLGKLKELSGRLDAMTRGPEPDPSMADTVNTAIDEFTAIGGKLMQIKGMFLGP